MKKWLDGFLLAGQGILLSAKTIRFWVFFIIFFFFFGTLMNLLSDGFASFRLMGVVGFPDCLKIILDALLGVFGIGRAFLDWLVVFLVAFLQGVLIALIAVVWKKKQKASSENLQSAGIVAGLAVLGTGCPTCGTALLTPILGTIFAGGGAIAGTVSWVVTILAILVAILSLRKIGEEAYVIIVSEKYLAKKKVEEK